MAVIVLAVLAAVVVLILLRPRREPGAPPTAGHPALSPAASGHPAVPASSVKPTPKGGAVVTEAGSAGSPSSKDGKSEPVAASVSAAGDRPWKAQPVADFTPADLDRVGEGVQVNLGDYRVAPGEAFDFLIRLTAPPLESATIILLFDPERLTVISDGARPVGSFFRRGIECYVDEKGGRAVLIHTGPPGKKNTNGATGEAVLAVRVRAGESEGDTAITLAPGSSFTSGRGGDEKFTTFGGSIHIRR